MSKGAAAPLLMVLSLLLHQDFFHRCLYLFPQFPGIERFMLLF